MGGLLVPILWDVDVNCGEQEMGYFDPPAGQTCSAYMSQFLQTNPGYLNEPDATSNCAYCPFSKGSEYLATLNKPRHVYGWRDICLTLLFVISSYSLVFIMMKLRSKRSKTAS